MDPDRKANIAYIDAANLDKALKDLGWTMDYRKFRIWLSSKYKVERAYIFIGYIPGHNNLYGYFKRCGFSLVFKDVVRGGNGEIKGNCDADLIVHAMTASFDGSLDQALLVSSDGDYAPLIEKLGTRSQLLGVLSPAPANKCSILLKRTGARISYIQDQKNLLERNKKAPDTDQPYKGPFRGE